MNSKFSLKQIHKITKRKAPSNLLGLTAENQTLKQLLEEACQELNCIFKQKKKLTKNKGKFILAPREYKNVVQQMESIRKNDTNQYRDLMREFKQSIKAKKQASAPVVPTNTGALVNSLFDADCPPSSHSKNCCSNAKEEPKENLPIQELRLTLLKELEASLTGKGVGSTRMKKKRKRRRVRKMKKQQKFKRIRNNLERFLSDRDTDLDGFDEITSSDVDQAQFDFCDDVVPPVACPPSLPASFTDCVQLIKQKKYKLRKTKRSRKEVTKHTTCEFEVNKDSAFQRALSEIGVRRKYFVMDEDTDGEEFEL